MDVAAFTAFTGPDGVELIEQPRPDPGPNEAIIDVKACAINRHDLWILQGESAMIDTDQLPFVTGLDVAGVVDAIGSNVGSVAEGDRVVLCPNETCGECRFCFDGPESQCASFSLYHGGLAEYAGVQASRLIHLPDSISFQTAAALPTAYMTAFQMLRRGNVGPGDLVFIPGVTGGVGVASVQLAALNGASTIGTSRSESKLSQVDALGLDYAISDADPEGIKKSVREIGTPDVMIDHLGGAFTELGQSVIRRGGRIVICGRTAGNWASIHLSDLFLNHKQLIGSTMGTQTDLERLVSLVETGQLSPVIDRTYALESTAEAFASMEQRSAVGKIIVTP